MVGKTRTSSLSRDTDLSKTDATRSIIEDMVDGLNDHRIDDIGQFFAPILDGWVIMGVEQKGLRNSKQLAKAFSGSLLR